MLPFFPSFFLSWHIVALLLFLPLQGAAVNVSRPLWDFSISQFCFVFSHSAFTPSVTPFDVVAWVLVDKGASISWIWGWCSGGRGWIKNQSNQSGLWRRRTPCETVNHVPLLNMGQGFTVVIDFCFFVLQAVVPVNSCCRWLQIGKISRYGQNMSHNQKQHICQGCIQRHSFSVCRSACCPFITCQLQPELPMPQSPPQPPPQRVRWCVLLWPVKSPQDHFGPVEVNSGSSLWWCRHSGPLSQRLSLNLTTFPQAGLCCSAG